MASAPDICNSRVENQKKELNAVLERLQSYLLYHFLALVPYPAQVRATLLTATNVGLDDHMHELAGQAGTLWREHSNAPPPPGSGPPPAVPEFTRLKPLLVGGSSDSLAERPRQWKTSPVKAAGAGAGKRKPAAGAEGSKATVGRGRSDLGEGARAFKARMLEWRASVSTRGAAMLAPVLPADTITTRSPHHPAWRPRRSSGPRPHPPRPRSPSSALSRRPPPGAAALPRAGVAGPLPLPATAETRGPTAGPPPPPGPGPGRSSGASTN